MLSELSQARLTGVHPDLRRVVEAAVERASFIVTEGLRSAARQAQMVAQGKSRTLQSRHLHGFAVDVAALVDGVIAWSPLSLYDDLARAFKDASGALNIPIVWGGDWPHFPDSDHFELDASAYPDPAPTVAQTPVSVATPRSHA